ncbi:nitrogen regulation protein NR(II) [Candidatus Omnitrophota bacterium]
MKLKKAKYKAKTSPPKKKRPLRKSLAKCEREAKVLGFESKHLRGILDNMIDGVTLVDLRGRIIDLNEAACRQHGYIKEEVLGKSAADMLVAPEDIPKFWNAVKRMSFGENVRSEEYKAIRKDGTEFFTSVNLSLLKNVSGKPHAIIAVHRDITVRKKAEEDSENAFRKIKEHEAQLLHAEKMASLGQVVAGVAHEINNPLFVIGGEAEMLSRETNERAAKETSATILEQVRRISDIIERLLEFARKKELKHEKIDLNSTLEKTIVLLGYQARLDSVEIVKKLSRELPKVKGDVNKLQEVFLNIMLNAVQAMKGGGKLVVTTRAEMDTKYGWAKQVTVEFKDTGKGIDEDTLKRMFIPLFSTKKSGVGLGLAISSRIIEEHNGVIEVSSEVGKGATFMIRLPAEGG